AGGDAGTANTEANAGAGVGTAGGGARPFENQVGGRGRNADNTTYNGTDGASLRGGDGGSSPGYGGGGGGAGMWGGGGGAASTNGAGSGGGGAGGYSWCLVSGCTSTTEGGSPYIEVSWPEPIGTSTTLSFSGTTRAISSKPVTLRAVVTPAPSTGTVNFTVDTYNQWGCEAVPVDPSTGVAECRTSIPGERGRHAVRAVYTDSSNTYNSSSHEIGFQVYGGEPAISPTPEVLFGEVELGKSTTRTITVSNVGDADMTLDATYGVYIAEYFPRARPPRSSEYTALDDQCSGRTVAPGASCAVVVKFAPSALGERTAEIEIYSDTWSRPDPVLLTGTGIAARPEPEPQPEERKPETPVTPAPTPSSPAPAAPVTPVKPAEMPAPRNPAVPVGASSPIGVSQPAIVTQSGGVRLPLVCPPGQACSVSGTLTLAITGGQARAAAKTTRVLVRFSGIRVAAGKTKTLSLKLPASFVKAQQKKGVRKLRTTLTVNTTLGSGQRVTRRQAVTLLIPRARVAQRRAAPRQAERPAFTG
ncbi:choice-of-anchor D domain-containing protein, partial [Conexibacter sp. JD483]|uniref:choice-of-anchor D domain-containing protein n=2 Tax=Conexibacter TaxID=191494 RepID=UPI0028705EBA